MVRDKTPGELMVTVLALIGKPLLQPSGQLLALPTLRLREALRGLPQFVRMWNLLASGQREQRQKAWINTNVPCPQRRNTVRLCVDAQAQIPARSPLDDTTALELAGRDVLLVKAHRPDTWHMDTCSRTGALNASGKGMLVSRLRRPLSLGFFASFL